jgi:hypothetical protein
MGECQSNMEVIGHKSFDLKEHLTRAAKLHCQDHPVAHEAIALCLSLLQINPNRRLTADQSLRHGFFEGQRDFIADEQRFHHEMLERARNGRRPGQLFSSPGGSLEELYRRLVEFAPPVQ